MLRKWIGEYKGAFEGIGKNALGFSLVKAFQVFITLHFIMISSCLLISHAEVFQMLKLGAVKTDVNLPVKCQQATGVNTERGKARRPYRKVVFLFC